MTEAGNPHPNHLHKYKLVRYFNQDNPEGIFNGEISREENEFLHKLLFRLWGQGCKLGIEFSELPAKE